jgi:hypothetical protein
VKNFIPLVLLTVFGLLLTERSSFAGNSTISTTVTTPQNLTSSGTLTITSTGALITTVSSTASVYFNDKSSDTLTVNNSGTIDENGTAANGTAQNALADNQGHLTLFVNNNAGAIIETSDDDVFHFSKASNVLTINNSGTILSLNVSSGSNQALNLSGINSTGVATINNNAGGLIEAINADAIRPSLNGVINNSGTIISVITNSAGSGADAIESASQNNSNGNSGVTITNGSTGLIDGGRHGITGGNTQTGTLSTNGDFTMSITNTAGGIIRGENGSGVNIDGFSANGSTTNEVVTINNAGLISGNGSTLVGTNTSQDGDGVDVDGDVIITNSGTIISLNTINDASEGVTVGGGTIINSGTIEGSVATPGGTNTAVGRGITLAGLDKDPTTDNPIPIQKIYTNTVITNSGLIKGDTDSGIAILGISGTTNFSVTITNTLGGTIEGGGAVGVIDGSALANGEGTASANNETVINYGTIKADGTGKAISLGTGNNSVQIKGGSASIIGDMSGGFTGTNTAALTIDPTAGQSFNYGGAISNFSSVEIMSGTVTFSGANTYVGTTTIDSALLNLTGSGSIGTTTTLTINAGGTFNLGGGSVTVSSLFNSGSIMNGSINTTGTGTVSGLSGNVSFNKSSAGVTTMSGTNTYTGGTMVTAGKLAVDGSITGSVSVSSGAELGGHGSIGGTIGGSGAVGPGNSPGILTAASTDPTAGLSYNFEFTQAGAPTWSNASGSGNDVLHLTAVLPFTAPLTSSNTVNLYFSSLSLTFDGGFFTDGSTDDLTSNITNATFKYYLLDNTNGTVTYNGNKYDLVTGTGTTVQINGANFGTGTVNGWTEQFTVAVPEPSTWFLIGLGALGLFIVSRRRNRIG